MKSKEEITKTVATSEVAPNDYNLIEIQCFLCLKEVAKMFFNKQISKTYATTLKRRILSEYEKQEKQFEFEHSMYQEYIKNIKKTESLRIKLTKMLNGKEPYNTPITEESLTRALHTSLEILNIVFKEDFQQNEQ